MIRTGGILLLLILAGAAAAAGTPGGARMHGAPNSTGVSRPRTGSPGAVRSPSATRSPSTPRHVLPAVKGATAARVSGTRGATNSGGGAPAARRSRLAPERGLGGPAPYDARRAAVLGGSAARPGFGPR